MRARAAVQSVQAADVLWFLRARGFQVGLGDCVCAERLLERLPDISPEEMHLYLGPLIVRNAGEQAAIRAAFEDYLRLSGVALARPGSPAAQQDALEHRSHRPRWWLWLAGSILLASIVGLGIWRPWRRPAEPARTPITVSPAVETTGGVEPAAPAPLLPPRPVPAPALQSAPNWFQRHGPQVTGTALLLPLLLFALDELRRRLRRRAGLVREASTRSPIAYAAPAPRDKAAYMVAPLLSAARAARQRSRDERPRLAIRPTIESTVRAGGYPTFRFELGARATEYLVLIERRSPQDHQALLFDTLWHGLVREDVVGARYFFDADPRICYAPGKPAGISLAELQQLHPAHRLVILSDGAPLLDPVSGEMLPWTTALNLWKERTLLTPEPPGRWGVREVVLAEHLLVLPATLEGIRAMADFYGGATSDDWETWWERHAGAAPALPGSAGMDALHAYLGDAAFRWLCACAVYPELHWNLTLHLAALGIYGEPVLGEENLLRLARIPWFRSGSIPNRYRESLLEHLSLRDYQTIRLALLRLIEHASPHSAGDAERARFDALVQKLFLFQQGPQRRSVLKELRRYPPAVLVQDVVVVRELERHVLSRAVLRLPRRMTTFLFRGGIGALGLRQPVRAATASLLALGAFAGARVVVRPPPATLLPFERLALATGDTLTLPAPIRAAAAGFTWSSADPGVLQVDSRGRVRAQGEGSTVIRAVRDTIVATYPVEVVASTSGATRALLHVGERLLSVGARARAQPLLESPGDLRWVSCSPGVVAVASDGSLLGRAPGSARIVGISSRLVELGSVVVTYDRGRGPRNFDDSLAAVIAKPLSVDASGRLSGEGLRDIAQKVGGLNDPQASPYSLRLLPHGQQAAALDAAVRSALTRAGLNPRRIQPAAGACDTAATLAVAGFSLPPSMDFEAWSPRVTRPPGTDTLRTPAGGVDPRFAEWARQHPASRKDASADVAGLVDTLRTPIMTVYFDPGSAAIPPSYESSFATVGAATRDLTSATVELNVVAWANPEESSDLATSRVDAVMQRLAGHGADRRQIFPGKVQRALPGVAGRRATVWLSRNQPRTDTAVGTRRPSTTVPKVVGLSFREAAAMLAKLSLRANAARRLPSTLPSEIVLDQSPAAGSRVRPGSAVVLVISAGPSDLVKQVNPYAPSDTALQKGGLAPLLLQASASPPIVAPGEPVRIVVRVMDGAKRPVSEVEVQVTAGGGSFAGGGTSAGGFTDKLGEYTTSWSCRACAPAYRMDVKGQKDGYPVPSDSVIIRIRTAAQKAD